MLLSLMLLPAALGAPLGVEGLAVPLYEHDGRCTDPRLPALAGEWLLSCRRGGALTHATHLPSGRTVELPRPLHEVGYGPGAVYATGREGGLFRLQADGTVVDAPHTTIHTPLVAPPATDGHHVAVLVEDKLQAFLATDRARRSWPSSARGWYPPALLWPYVAWVSEGQGEDVSWIDLDGDQGPQLLAGGPGHQRHVVASATHLAWVEERGVVVFDPQSRSRTLHPTTSGFDAPPTLWGGVACWEERHDDVDIVCSDGIKAAGPGHQRHPSRHGRWLLYREEGRLMLLTAPAS